MPQLYLVLDKRTYFVKEMCNFVETKEHLAAVLLLSP